MPADAGSHEGPQQAPLRLLVKQSSCVHASHPALPYSRQSVVRGDGGQAFGVRWNLHPVQIHYLSSRTLDTLWEKRFLFIWCVRGLQDYPQLP